ncbi:MAG: pyridoxamine 5'-phosphate oxidase [Jatrophihabitans sp.]
MAAVSETPIDLAAQRRTYRRGQLDESQVADGWLPLFRRWYDEAADDSIVEPNAMQLATVDAEHRPAVRTVLAKLVDETGVVFYTGYDSAKAHELAANSSAAVVFAWLALERQVRISGQVDRVTAAETAEYFASRPRGSQIGAWASHQSAPLRSRNELTSAMAATERQFAGRDVPVPPDWGGYRITPEIVEFWAGREDRLHDRLQGRLDAGAWRWQRLSP